MKIVNTGLGLLGSRFLGRPFYARYHCTYRCNYRCGMCGLHRQVADYPELSAGEVERVAERLWAIGARHAVITGGEPFLRKDLPALVGAFARRGFSVRIQTNGGPQVTKEALAAAAGEGLRDLSVSMDTLDGALQDQICGATGVVENALRALSWAVELLPRGMSLANVVASRRNFAELPALVERMHSAGAYTYITPVMLADPASDVAGDYLFRSHDRSFAIEGLDAGLRDGVIDRLIAQRRAGLGLTNSTRQLEDFRRYLATGRCEWRCEAGTLCLDVRPDGRVSICKEKPPLGNILEPDFLAVYRSEAFRRTAREMAGRCKGCFYGEYREPQYAVRDISVLAEWVRDWVRTFRRGMGSGAGGNAR